ncbi:MAG: FtsX-like permease family protein [Planctomycetaceae bacterium]|jgi:ABC-type lipoprotein release transport system permease subunit
MNVWRLVVREIKHRRLNFAMGLLSVAVAVASVVGAETLLTADRIMTGRLLSAKEAEVEKSVAEKQAAVQQAGKELQDMIRKQMLGLGFNVLILPASQSLSEIHLNGSMSETMPENYVDKLAKSKIVTVNHLLPSVTRRIHWEEQDREVVVVGTRGEVPIQHRGMKKPLLDEVAEGKMVVGHEIHRQLKLKKGDPVQFKGREFTVSKLHDERGSVDDVTVWINLGEAQELLGMQNQINAILALECDCSGDRISQIRTEIAEILPGTQVIERYSQALARAESRAKAKESAEAALRQAEESGVEQMALEQRSRQDLEDRHAGFAAILVPLVILGSIVTIGLLALANSRQRCQEIGILRAIGLSTRQLMSVFLIKAAAVGLLGGLAGVAAGLTIGRLLGSAQSGGTSWNELFASVNLPIMILAAPLSALFLSGLASWLPALFAARQDPAVILQRE